MTPIPLFSVVIPLYNKEKYIARAIKSVLTQTLQDFELIIVEGSSTDTSNDIVNKIYDPRIIITEQTGMGVSQARNQGIQQAKGKYIAFLDADDEWEPNFLQTIFELILAYPNSGIYGTAFSVYSNEKYLRSVCHTPAFGNRQFSSYFKEFVSVGYPIIITSGFSSPKTVLEIVGGYCENLRIGEDHDLFGKIALEYPVSYSPIICTRYNIGTDNNADIVDYVLEVPLEDHLDTHHANADDSSLSDYMDHWRLRIGGRNIYSGFSKEGRDQLRQIRSKKYSLMKAGFMLLSCMPISLSRLPPNFVRGVLRVVKLSL